MQRKILATLVRFVFHAAQYKVPSLGINVVAGGGIGEAETG